MIQISLDLRSAFPKTKGFGTQNLKYMTRFAKEYDLHAIGQQAVDQIPWGHNIILMYKVKDRQEREFYIKETIKNGWSRNILAIHIERDLYHVKGKAISNFKSKLPSPHSELAQNMLKDPYCFDFLSNFDALKERDIEFCLIKHIEKFLIELGKGFAYVGRQYHIEVGEQDFYIDLLFYHLELRSFVVIEIKNAPFKPEYAGKLNFYLSVIDDL